MRYLIVRASNFDCEWYNEEYVNLPPMAKHAAEELCKVINTYFASVTSDHIWKVVDSDYKLYIGMVA